MTININELFIRAGKAFQVGEVNDAHGFGSMDVEIKDAITELNRNWDDAQPPNEAGTSPESVIVETGRDLPAAIVSGQNAISQNTNIAVRSYIRRLVEQTVSQSMDISSGVLPATIELIRQMRAKSPVATLQNTVLGQSIVSDTDNTGNGTLVLSTVGTKGETLAHSRIESIIFESSTTSPDVFTSQGNIPRAKTHPKFLASGSGTNVNVISTINGGVSNAGLEDEDTNVTNAPDEITITGATAGTGVLLTATEVQTLTIAGSPGSGWWSISYTHPGSTKLTTDRLAWNSDASDVQTAIRSLSRLELVEVSSSGTAPNLTYSCTMTGVAVPALLEVDENFNTGTLTPSVSVAGSAFVHTGSRCLKMVQSIEDAFELWIPVTVSPNTVYFLGAWFAINASPGTAGSIDIGLYDGIGGSVITNDNGDDNKSTFAASTLNTTMSAKSVAVESPAVLPDNPHFGIKVSGVVTATEDLYIDDLFFLPARQLYQGGPYALMLTGSVPWETGDRITGSITLTSRGDMHSWMNRCLDLDLNNLLMPTESSPDIPDTLIS
jgi:hypothetical protein